MELEDGSFQVGRNDSARRRTAVTWDRPLGKEATQPMVWKEILYMIAGLVLWTVLEILEPEEDEEEDDG